MHNTVKKLFGIFLLLSFLALLIISLDYSNGHMGQDPFIINTCSLCVAYSMLELGEFSIDYLHVFVSTTTIEYTKLQRFLPLSYYETITSPRSPPFS